MPEARTGKQQQFQGAGQQALIAQVHRKYLAQTADRGHAIHAKAELGQIERARRFPEICVAPAAVQHDRIAVRVAVDRSDAGRQSRIAARLRYLAA